MLSELTEAMIVNGVVLATVLATDVGPARKISKLRLLRPDTTPVEEIMSVEGSASDVVITSEVTDLHKVFDVAGAYTYTVTWAPRKSC